jgi:hypothetical protein
MALRPAMSPIADSQNGISIGAAPFVPQSCMYETGIAPYDAVDPALAVAMFNAASAAANAAAGCYGMPVVGPVDEMHAHRSRARPSQAQAPRVQSENAIPTFEDLETMGDLVNQARTASGSSFIQAAVKEGSDPRCLFFIWAQLAPQLPDLLLDAHGCYVIKTLLEQLPKAEVEQVLLAISNDDQLGFSVCTHSLHTRRVVQHIIENIDGSFLCDLMSRHCREIATTQQGCIVMQRSMDNAPQGPSRDKLFNAVCVNLVDFAKDPFANYVVQHLMEIGDRTPTATSMWSAFRGRVVELACNKFASNVIEKCLFHCTAEVQHEMLVEMYSVGPQMLYNMLQDSFGNYIIQSSIALATFRDIAFIDQQLRPVLAHTPYGYKIEARLDRRLKGKPVNSRGQVDAPHDRAPVAAAPKPQHRRPQKVPAGERPW